MPLRRAYKFTGKAVLADITRLGLGSAFGALWGELQFTPKAPDLGVVALKGLGEILSEGHMVRLGHTWLYYAVDDAARVVHLLDLIPIL